MQRNTKCAACTAKVGLYRFMTRPKTALMMTSSASDDRTRIMSSCTVVTCNAVDDTVSDTTLDAIQMRHASRGNIESALKRQSRCTLIR
jgi:hypothetical protein